MIINVIVAEKNAIAMPHEALVCGNSDYIIEFDFDAEWDQHPTKTARFIFDDRSYTDVVFTGNQCRVPVLTNTHEVIVGVFAGNLTTTTPAYLRAQRSILCYGGEKIEIHPDQYDQIMSRINQIETIATGAVQSDWFQNSAVAPDYIKNRTHYDVAHMSVARGASVDADAPSARIYRSDGSEASVRWVKVSDHAPDAEIFISAGRVQTGEYGHLKVLDEHIINLTDKGYMISREQYGESTGRTLRIVYAAVCFEAGYKVLGYPAFEVTSNTSTATLPEPGVYLPVTDSSQTTYYGYELDTCVKPIDEKYIPHTIARKKDLENVIIPEPTEQVTDEHINALIDAKLSAFGTQTILAEQTLPGEDDDGDGVNDMFFCTGAWDTAPVVGSTYDVYYNGTKYTCEAVAMPEDAALAPGAMAMGNLADMGFDGIVGNPDAPFAMVCLPESMGGIVGMFMPMDGATAVTLFIRSANVGYYYYDGSRAQIVTIDQLKADLGLTVAVELSCDEDGDATITGAILTVDEEGNATLTGYTPSVDGDGNAQIN